MIQKLLFIGAACCFTHYSIAQDEEETESTVDTNLVEQTFQSTRIVSGHSVECLRKGVLEFRVEHRFGDLADPMGEFKIGLD
ncbi:DUF5777 family beta-barrel protein [Fluviicola sp.]|uniref:DUF5777 family beta-barrel protein n=1 Tax=Fluviicola sp. TaxID=1917219 RepID=UPI003D293D10